LTLLFVTPQYRASANFYVNNTNATYEQEFLSDGNISASVKLVRTYIEITKSASVMDETARRLGVGYTAASLSKLVKAEQVNSTELFAIYVTCPDPVEAAKIANVLAEVVPETISSIIEGSSARVIDYAEVPTSRFSPNYARNTLVGLAVGLLLVFLIVTVDFLLDVRIKDEEELISISDLPVLGRIPEFSSLSGAKERADRYGYDYGYGGEKAAQKEGDAE
ncbi:MAG: YveK family protein, partial [bacterium]